jgi:hypothetical protein
MWHIYIRNFRELVDMSMTEFVSNLERELMTTRKEKSVAYSYKKSWRPSRKSLLIGVCTMTSELNGNLHKINDIKRTLRQRRENAMFTMELLFCLCPSSCASFVDLNIRKQRKWHGANINQQTPFWLQNTIGSIYTQHTRSSPCSGALWLLS